MKIVVLGLSITSSWGNGHATTFRALLRELAKRGHAITFLERDVPWYADNRDLPNPAYCEVKLYKSLDELKAQHKSVVAAADVVIVGSYVPEGVAVGEWALATAQGVVGFYDIDTPVTLAKLKKNDYEYLSPELIARYDVYLSFTGGPTLRHIETAFGSPAARPLYCSVDADLYHPTAADLVWDLGYLGTYSDDRQPTLERLLNQAARQMPSRRFVVAGPQYPESIRWPSNVERIMHLPPAEHVRFYASQRFALNVTRADMIAAGYSPSVRLFEAAACGVPIISDEWPGLETFFEPGREILLARTTEDVVRYVGSLAEDERRAVGERARARVLASHTAEQRAAEFEAHVVEAMSRHAVQT